MKKYFCKNGEYVFVSDIENEPDFICVRYRGKNYKRPRDIIGKTLFPRVHNSEKTKDKVKFGSFVDVKRIGENAEHLRLYLAPNEFEYEYCGMGGSYYGARTKKKRVISRLDSLPEGRMAITTDSPLGKVLKGRNLGDIVTVRTPDNEKIDYKIVYINNYKHRM